MSELNSTEVNDFTRWLLAESQARDLLAALGIEALPDESVELRTETALGHTLIEIEYWIRADGVVPRRTTLIVKTEVI